MCNLKAVRLSRPNDILFAVIKAAPQIPKKYTYALLAGCVVILVFTTVGYIYRSWVRVSLLPFATGILIRRSVSQAESIQSNLIHEWLPSSPATHGTVDCGLLDASNLMATVECSAPAESQYRLPDETPANGGAQHAFDHLVGELRRNGWAQSPGGAATDGSRDNPESANGAFLSYQRTLKGPIDCTLNLAMYPTPYSAIRHTSVSYTLACSRSITWF